MTHIDFNRFYSWETVHRERPKLSEFRRLAFIAGMISFANGNPHPSSWPVNGMILSVPSASKSIHVPGYNALASTDMFRLEASTAKHDPELEINLTDALQYGCYYGPPAFVRWLEKHVSRNFPPAYKDWSTLLISGNTNGVDAILRSCLNKGDYLLVEEFAYSGTLSCAATMGVKSMGVPCDSEGIIPEKMDDMLTRWEEVLPGVARPKMLLVVPTCSNPGGMTFSAERKEKILQICRRWDMLVVEDDPYYFLQLAHSGKRVPTFLELDTEGRVLRIDSFSKIVAPGSRLGFITGHKVLVEKLMESRESTTHAPSGFSVVGVTGFLQAVGSHEGFESKYIPRLVDFYSSRCMKLVHHLQKHLPSQCVEPPVPKGGMFLWMRVKVENHPLAYTLDPEDISDRVFNGMLKNLIFVVPSSFFETTRFEPLTPEEKSQKVFLRVCFAMPGEDELEEGARRMGVALRQEWGLTGV